jgi:hypothetical protein
MNEQTGHSVVGSRNWVRVVGRARQPAGGVGVTREHGGTQPVVRPTTRGERGRGNRSAGIVGRTPPRQQSGCVPGGGSASACPSVRNQPSPTYCRGQIPRCSAQPGRAGGKVAAQTWYVRYMQAAVRVVVPTPVRQTRFVHDRPNEERAIMLPGRACRCYFFGEVSAFFAACHMPFIPYAFHLAPCVCGRQKVNVTITREHRHAPQHLQPAFFLSPRHHAALPHHRTMVEQ